MNQLKLKEHSEGEVRDKSEKTTPKRGASGIYDEHYTTSEYSTFLFNDALTRKHHYLQRSLDGGMHAYACYCVVLVEL